MNESNVNNPYNKLNTDIYIRANNLWELYKTVFFVTKTRIRYHWEHLIK